MTFSANWPLPSDASLLWSDSHAAVAFYDHRLQRVDLESKKSLDCRSGSSSFAIFSLFAASRLPSGARKPKNRNSSTACLSMKLVMRSWTRFRVSCVDVFNLTHHRNVAERQSACERVGKAHFCGQIKACDYHRSVTWSAASKGHRRRPTENRWNCKRLHFLSRLPTTRPATPHKFELERWNVWNPSVSLSVCCRFTPWSQFVMFPLRFVSGFVYVFDKRSAKRVLFCATYLFFARRLIDDDDEIPSGFETLACEYLGIPATETAAINWNRLLIKFELPSSADYSFIIYERSGTRLPM